MSLILLHHPVNNRKKSRTFRMADQVNTRASSVPNPLELNPPVSLNMVTANQLPKWGDYAYVGGTEETHTYDFSLKVAGDSTIPCKIYRQYGTSLINATDASWNSSEVITQAYIDNIKTQDGTVWTPSITSSGYYAQAMAEFDLTEIVNKLSSGSNADFKTNKIKSITYEVYMKGSGSNGGVATDGAIMYAFLTDSNTYTPLYTNNTSAIQRALFTTTTGSNKLSASNKIYILVASQYPSDGTIASSISIDTIRLTVVTNRSADVVNPVNVNLTRYWGMVVKGWSPNWTDTTITGDKRIASMYDPVNSELSYYDLFWQYSGKKFLFRKAINGVGTTDLATSGVTTLSKFQSFNLAFGQNSAGMFMFILPNNGTTTKYTNANINQLLGAMKFIPLMMRVTGIQQADSYADQFTLIDLTSNPNGYTDAEWDAILKMTDGNRAGIGNRYLTGTDKVLPNNRYSLSGGTADLYYGNIKTRTVFADFTTNGYENKIVISAGALCKLKM